MSSANSVPRTKLTGICPAAQTHALAELLRQHPAPVWLVIHEEAQKNDALAEDIALFHAANAGKVPLEILSFPEAQTGEMREAFNAASDRLAVLSRLRGLRNASAKSGTLLVLTTPAALLQPVPPLADFATREAELVRGEHRSFQALLDLISSFDYDSEAVCEAPGQYAVRGGIVDVYPITAHQPYRLDFFGDTLEEIRTLDPVTQRSGESVERVILTAAPKLHTSGLSATLLDYLSPATHAALLEPKALEELFDTLAPDAGRANPPDEPRADGSSGRLALPILEKLPQAAARLFGISDLDLASRLFDAAAHEETWDTESLSHHRAYPEERLLAHERLAAEEDARRQFLEKVADWKHAGYAVDFVVSKEGEEQRIRELLAEHAALKKIKPRFLRGSLTEGFRLTLREGRAGTPLPAGTAAARSGVRALPTGLVVVSETEIFGRQRARRTIAKRAIAATSAVDQLLDFSELVEGDFVVHLQHGIAQYRGLTKLETADGIREVISLEFDDKVTLHVPLQESHLISRYVGLTKTKPQLGRVGSGRWEKARQSAERSTLDLAAELLAIQAQREAQPGHAFAADNVWMREFEAAFPFAETRDQAKAITDLKADMERTRPMDRLLCGDVGFGKTEVAIRGAFKAVMGGKQVAVLVPTTVLAQQHLNTFRERMAGYPVAVEMLSRFRTRKEQEGILAALAEGKIDILIGTHRLVQDDVKFKDLGLVIVDEEQRFGVKHKEVFKRWRAHVDMLSMSATPIPRTLYLALTGARDLSTIETAPANRLPIQTIVKSYDEKLVVEAIQHELRRGGQVFYLHNRVMSIDLVAARLRDLLPGVTVGVGHGKMGADGLERMMTDFVAGQYQVLVCTTIIESGLDIPNCNTLIIEGADRFGLSQLYQLRGRVGRFKHQAYAYLLLHRHTRLLDVARQRLSAMRQHNQLGAGFRIAMRDLELRGAGNLLGAEQSGHIVGVGFELYCQLLRQSVARLKGEKHAALVRANVKLDFVFVGEGAESERARAGATDSFSALKQTERIEGEIDRIQARLPAGYIGETRLRIDFYRRLALAENPKQVKELEAELRDRFGKFTEPVKALLLVTEIRVRAEQKGVLSVETQGSRLKCLRNSGRRDDFIQLSSRFPRLTAPTPLARLREIIIFLQNLPTP
ncbi:transcription-repair coupling factor [Opitutus sp. GAS368]|uniref:transcription-repair coupling factor n=1 Tax=Opitutus sp. GAS368 TaxID=1882749 RepID=UPI00087D661E|nr:transcription-repair coupling factor [Opitutus sp. GAS368]SDS66983.1 transcription-repair coupling factor (superfamily II helicase) [Opitutus sp. GAS368]